MYKTPNLDISKTISIICDYCCSLIINIFLNNIHYYFFLMNLWFQFYFLFFLGLVITILGRVAVEAR